MANGIEGLPAGRISGLLRDVEAVLRADPVLSSVVRTWLTYAGPTDQLPPPTPDDCPFCRLSLTVDFRPGNISNRFVYVGVGFELATAGEQIDDITDLWEAFANALDGDKPYAGTTVRGFFNRAKPVGNGSFDFNVASPRFRTTPEMSYAEAGVICQIDFAR